MLCDSLIDKIKLNVVAEASALLLAPILPIFVECYSNIELKILSNNDMIDIIEEHEDAGICYGGTVPDSMIA